MDQKNSQKKVYDDLLYRLKTIELNSETILFLLGYYESLFVYECISRQQWTDLRKKLNADPEIITKINYY